ncbi:addiction module antidote protein, HigA family [Helicobacter jaachi]|uniref:Addiction module antidote protein, HigA family n=1 Tax=Helicobacter jaachi TaxID=1677920 RepID=A0A4U8T5P5_9HELI|nr:HigA family addiction module antitoxin [Helicobacter jaachi]TLD94851.1 addiction module antidote protein, HigA family [Helicobacter jaachi]
MTRRPSHAGEILKELYLNDLGISQQAFAKALGVSFRTINEIVNKKRAISVDMALRLSLALGTTPQFWLNLQNNYDVFLKAKDKKLADIKPLFA